MTRNEFMDIDTFWELRDFCSDYGLEEFVDCYVDGDDVGSDIWEDIRDADCSWYDLGGYLCDIADGCDFYYRNGWLDYIGYDVCDSAFDELKERIADYCSDRGDIWDEEEDEEEDETETEEKSDPKTVMDELWWGLKAV